MNVKSRKRVSRKQRLKPRSWREVAGKTYVFVRDLSYGSAIQHPCRVRTACRNQAYVAMSPYNAIDAARRSRVRTVRLDYLYAWAKERFGTECVARDLKNHTVDFDPVTSVLVGADGLARMLVEDGWGLCDV